jgi:endogenous inhibitor of DNA gyrase (YacG/DUF329 family)
MLEVDCPHCGKRVPWTKKSRWRPFCSERCRLIDLGQWFEEEHAIPGEPTDADGIIAREVDEKER